MIWVRITCDYENSNVRDKLVLSDKNNQSNKENF